MTEPLPDRRHSFPCFAEENCPDSSGLNDAYYEENAKAYLVNHIKPEVDQAERGSYSPLVGEKWEDASGPSSSYYASPRSSLFSNTALACSTSDPNKVQGKDEICLNDEIHEEEVRNLTNHDQPIEVAVHREKLHRPTSRSSSKKSRKRSAANGSARSNTDKPLRITTFNLNHTYIPPPTPRMSLSQGTECENGQPHQLLSMGDYVVTTEQLKLARDRAREKVRKIVVGVSVTLTLLAVILVATFLALGNKLEQQERNGRQQFVGSGSPFADDNQPIRISESASPPKQLPMRKQPKHEIDNSPKPDDRMVQTR